MPPRRLSPEERALWARVISSVTPMEGRASPVPPEPVRAAPGRQAAAEPYVPRPSTSLGTNGGVNKPVVTANTLDGGWDRKITRGRIEPDFAVDLHGHTLDSAWTLLDRSLARAIADGARVVLLITGKPPRAERPGRGLIRAAVSDWITHSRHARHIAAVRNAHPRHGGTGALYIILKRPRTTP